RSPGPALRHSAVARIRPLARDCDERVHFSVSLFGIAWSATQRRPERNRHTKRGLPGARTMASVDLVVIGAGHNGLVAANYLAKFSKKDAAAYPKYEAMWAEVYDLVEPMLLAPPVPIADLVSLLRGPEAEDLLRRLLFYSAEELLDEYFESDRVKAAFANESV